MNDYEFGDYLYNLRKASGLTQTELAEMLDVTNKAVSKWETGASKPTITKLTKLSKIYNVGIDELLQRQLNESPKKITKIVITGGPCAGKSTAMSWIQETFNKKGYAVLFIPETATELIMGGAAPWTLESNYDFQTAVLKLQIEKEKVFEQAAQKLYDKNKILIVCDRGTLDGKGYMSKYEFQKLLKSLNLTETHLKDEYDGVFHLVTAAKGAEQFYTLENNQARTETKEEAVEKDNNLISAWAGHPHLRIIDNSTDFENKMKKLMAEISALLGEPTPFEIERKFLIHYPDINLLQQNPNCQKVEIIRTYLKSDSNDEIRVRQRGINGSYTYTKTIKKVVSDIKRLEIEKRISEKEYLDLLMDADTNKRQIRKTRYCLVHNNQYFEIDIYPFWQDKAIMEIELNNENQKIDFPPNISIIKEVTQDEYYKNYNLANIKD